MKILIIEDEKFAAKRLIASLEELEPTWTIVDQISSVKELEKWLSQNDDPDLIFSDIEIQQGNVFDAFKKKLPQCPIIFVTAHNSYLLDAFKSNGIEYLMKPFEKSRLEEAVEKFHRLKKSLSNVTPELLTLIKNEINKPEDSFKTRFTIKRHKGIELLDTDNISIIKLDQTGLFAYDDTEKYYPLHDYTLSSLESKLDPKKFFRINRNEIVNINYIEIIKNYSKDRLQVIIKNKEFECLTSSHRTPEFRKWINNV